MCYLLAKRFDSTGSLALQTAHGQHLAEFKRKLIEKIGYSACHNQKTISLWRI